MAAAPSSRSTTGCRSRLDLLREPRPGRGRPDCCGQERLTIENSTITANTADNSAGGLRTDSNDALIKSARSRATQPLRRQPGARLLLRPRGRPRTPLQSTLIADPKGGGDNCGAGVVTVISRGGNIDEGDTCGFSAAAGDLINTDPKLVALESKRRPDHDHGPPRAARPSTTARVARRRPARRHPQEVRHRRLRARPLRRSAGRPAWNSRQGQVQRQQSR